MAPTKGIPLLDAATLLVGWSNRTASRPAEKVFVSGEVVELSGPPASGKTQVRLHTAPAQRAATLTDCRTGSPVLSD